MTQLRESYQWQTRQAGSCAFRGLPFVTLFPGFILGAAVTEVLWPNHLLWTLAVFVGFVLLGLLGLIVAIKRTGSLTTSLVGSYLLGGIIILANVFATPSAVKEVCLRTLGNVAQGVAVASRIEVDRRQRMSYFIAYEFSLQGEEWTYANEQAVHSEIYETIATGSGIEIQYWPSDPTLSLLTKDALGKVTISLWLGMNFGGALLIAGILLLDRLVDKALHHQETQPDLQPQ